MAENIRNVTAHRLLIGFSFIILLFIAFGVISLIEIRTLSKVTRTIYNHPLVVSNASLRATTSMIKMHRSMKDVALFDFPSGINIAINAVNEQERMVFKSLDAVKKNILGAEGQKLENETRHLFVTWKPIREEVIKLVSKGQREEAAKITIGKGADHVAKLENKMLELTSYARNKATGFMRHGEKVRSRIMKTTIILISIGLLLSGFIAFFTIRRTQTAEEALQESEEKFRILFNQAADSVVLVDSDTQALIDFNDIAHQNLGFTREEFKMLKVQDLEVVEKPEETKRHSIKVKREGSGTFETKLRAKTGKIHDFLMKVRLVSFGGNDYILGTWHEITDIKRAEEQIKSSLKEKEVLLQEIHHRVNNNMQVIISLIRLQCERIDDEQYIEMFKDTLDRIKSMALVHKKLYQSKDFAKIDCTEYVKSLMKELFKSYGVDSNKISIKLEKNDVSLSLDNAVSCGIIINELVTNSLKYAFPGNIKGDISIGYSLIDKGQVEIRVADNGVGMPESFDFRNSDTLGLQIVVALAEHQLGGKVSVSTGKGTEFRIWFKEPSH
jgi:PAS domain S-box-containing protein